MLNQFVTLIPVIVLRALFDTGVIVMNSVLLAWSSFVWIHPELYYSFEKKIRYSLEILELSFFEDSALWAL